MTVLLRMLKILGVAVIAIPVCLVCLVMLYWFVVFPIRYEFGWNGQGASHKANEAMQQGNGQEAIYWSKKTLAFSILGRGADDDHSTWERLIAQAYELDGQYEMAINWYKISGYSLPEGRIYYKMDRSQESFEAYCRYANSLLEQSADRFKPGHGRERMLTSIRDDITMDNAEMWLTAFVDYKDFMQFMETEYEKLGKPEKYEKALKLFRLVATEIGDMYDLNPNTSDWAKENREKHDKMREQIREKRKRRAGPTATEPTASRSSSS